MASAPSAKSSVAARKLRSWLETKGNSQVALAAAMEISQAAVHKWSIGKARPNASHRRLIEIITGGAVPAALWDTAAERKLIDAVQPCVPPASTDCA